MGLPVVSRRKLITVERSVREKITIAILRCRHLGGMCKCGELTWDYRVTGYDLPDPYNTSDWIHPEGVM